MRLHEALLETLSVEVGPGHLVLYKVFGLRCLSGFGG